MKYFGSNLNVYKYLVSLFVSIYTLAPQPLSAQSLNGYAFCLDPGHGPGNINTGPTGLHEHIINMRASRALSDLLYSVNADTVILTRDESTTTDPTLSQREQIANSNNVDWFHAVHHNATGWPENPTVRYTLVLYSQNSDNTPLNPGSEAMSPLISQRLYQGLRTSEYRTFGDFNFYGSPNYLGVLNDLTMPSELSEATFHDHPGEEAKLYNPDFTRMEGRGIFYGMLDYFTGIHYTDGVISGIVTDDDTGEPLDSVWVHLSPGDSLHHTDNHHSGYFAFHHLASGQYVVSIEKEGYVTLTDTVQVHPGLYDFADFSTGSTAAPTVVNSTPSDSATGFGIWDNLSIQFSRPMNTESVVNAIHFSNANNTQTFVPSWDNAGEVITLNPLGALTPGTWYQLTIDTSATDLFGHGLADSSGNFTVHFQTSPSTDQMIPIEVSPNEQESDVSLASTIGVVFSRPLAGATDYTNKMIILSDNFHRIVGRVDVDTLEDGSARGLTLIPDTPLQTNRSYTATLLSSISDTAGQTMAAHFTWTFHATDHSYQIVRLDSGQSLVNWVTDFQSNANVSGEFIPTPAIRDNSALKLTISNTNETLPGEGGLRWTGSPIEVSPGHDFGFYAKSAAPILFGLNGEHLATFAAFPGWHFYSFASEEMVSIGGVGFTSPAGGAGIIGYLDEVLQLTDITGLANDPIALPDKFDLLAYPNPFNPSITMVLPSVAGEKTMALYDLSGRQLTQFSVPDGEKSVRLNFLELLPTASSGIYLVRLSTPSHNFSTKILYLK